MSDDPTTRQVRGSILSGWLRRMLGKGTAAAPPDEVGPGSADRPAEVGPKAVTLRATGVPVNGSADLGALVREIAAAAATAVWRLQSRVDRGRQEQSFDPPKWLIRQLESARDALSAVGIEAKGHTGEPYVPGLALTVLAFEPRDGATAEVIAETIKPSVYFKEALVQAGEVIVATPPSSPPLPDRSEDGGTA